MCVCVCVCVPVCVCVCVCVCCRLYTSDAADDEVSVYLGGGGIDKEKSVCTRIIVE